jgi:hypothetical protein
MLTSMLKPFVSSVFTLSLERLCRNTVHGSRASPRTVLHDQKFKYLPVRPELVEGLRANCDTVSDGRGKSEGEVSGNRHGKQLDDSFH